MAAYDQIEIIYPQGNIAFEKLDPLRGATTIGRSQGNDVQLLDSDGSIANVHMMIYHRSKPYQVVVYAEVGETKLGDEVLRPNEKRALHDGDTISLNGHVLVYLEGQGVAGPGIPGTGGYAFSDSTGMQMLPTVNAGHDQPDAGSSLIPASERGLAEQPNPQQTPSAMQMSDPVQEKQAGVMDAVLRNREVVVAVGQKAAFAILITNVHKTERQTFYLTVQRILPDGESGGWNGGFKIEGIPPARTASNTNRTNRPDIEAIAELTLNPNESKTIEAWVTTKLEGEHHFTLKVFSKQTAQLPYLELMFPACLRAYRGDTHDTQRPANIEIEMAERDGRVEPGLPTQLSLLIHNRGQKEANWTVYYEWVANEQRPEPVWPVQVRLPIYAHAGETKAVPIVIDTDADTTVAAGIYPIRFSVMSGAYPGSQCSLVARVRVEAQDEFEVTGLSQSKMRTGFVRRITNTTFYIRNRSNRAMNFVVSGADRAGECDFWMSDPSDPETAQVLAKKKQPPRASHQLHVGQGESKEVQAAIQPRRRYVLSARPITHDVTFSTAMVSEPPQAAQLAQGQVENGPLFSVWGALALLVLSVVGLVLLLWPKVTQLSVDTQASTNQQPFAVTGGQPITLSWDTAWGSTIRVAPQPGLISGNATSIVLRPFPHPLTAATSLSVTADNLLSTVIFPPGHLIHKLINSLPGFANSKEVTGTVKPVTPAIDVFDANLSNGQSSVSGMLKDKEIYTHTTGSPFPLRWDVNWQGVVTESRSLKIFRSDGEPPLVITSDAAEEGALSLDRFNVSQTVWISLEAWTPFGVNPITKSLELQVQRPPLPPARILRFDVSPLLVTPNDEVFAEYITEGATKTEIYRNGLPLGAPVAPIGREKLETAATSITTTATIIYQLIVTNGDGKEERSQERTVTVVPKPIDLNASECATRFTLNTPTVKLGTGTLVTLTWNIPKDDNDRYYRYVIDITGPTINPLINQPISGSIRIEPTQNTNFFLSVRRNNVNSANVSDVLSCRLDLLVTPADPPPAIINFFIAVDASGLPIPDGASLNSQDEITLRWQTTNAISTTLKLGQAAVAPQPVSENNLKYKVSPNNNSFILQAYGAGAPSQPASLRFVIAPKNPPAPAYLVVDDTQNPPVLTWTHPNPAEVTKFVIRRSPDPGASYINIAYPGPVGNNNVFTDTVAPVLNCGYTYFIETYFLNNDGKEQLGSNSNNYPTKPCPVPTATGLPPELSSQIQPGSPTPTPIP
jgi:hypothetical protein